MLLIPVYSWQVFVLRCRPDALRSGVDDFVRAAIAVAIVGSAAAALSRLSALPELRTTYLGVAATAALYRLSA